MDLEKIGQFLAALRKERGLTQEQLGQRLGVTNKTVSRWEKGNYLPSADMLKGLSELYDVSINEILSGKRLSETAYMEQAEENITAIIKESSFSKREKLTAIAQWLRKNWWAALLCMLPAAGLYAVMPFVVSGQSHAAALATSLLLTGGVIIVNHIVFHISAAKKTDAGDAHKTAATVRIVWLVAMGVLLFLCMDLLLALLYSLTPAGMVDGYEIRSMFYDVLIEDGGNYSDHCFQALERTLWQLFLVVVINLDLAILWTKRRAEFHG